MEHKKRQIGTVILAGGRSRRMGTNKALLRLRPGGPTLIEVVITRLTEAGLAPTMLVTNTPADYTFLDLPAVQDDVAGAGALGGILTALTHSLYSRNMIVGCDMPFLNPALLKYMAALPTDSDVLLPRWTTPGGPTHVETLHAIYTTRCIEPIRQRIIQGRLKVSDLLENIAAHYIEEPDLRRYDPDLSSFRNINTPEDLSAATRI